MTGHAIVLVCSSEEQADVYASSAHEFMPPSIEVRRSVWPPSEAEQRILALHQPAGYQTSHQEWPACRECGHAFPCPTVQAIEDVS